MSTTRSKLRSSSAITTAAGGGNHPNSSDKTQEKLTSTTTPKSQPNRVFTEQDEIHLLKAFRRTSKSSSTLSLSSLIGAHFSENQITDKLRRLRLRYHKLARSKSLIKTPHDRRIFKISRKIWGKKNTNPSSKKRNSKIEAINQENDGFEEVGLEDFPALMEEVSRIFPENDAYREGLKCLGSSKLRVLNKKWMVQRMEEDGHMAKRAHLKYEQSKLIVEAVVSSNNEF